MELLETEFLGNSVTRWGLALCAMLASLLFLLWLRRALRGKLGALLSSLPGAFDDIAVKTIASTHGWFLFAIALLLGSLTLRLEKGLRDQLQLAILIVTFVQAGLWVTRGVRFGVEAWSQREGAGPSQGTLGAGIKFISNLAVWSIVLLLVLQNLGVKVGALVAGLGVGGVAAALALQAVLGDLFASLSIYIDRPFDIGDFIIVGDYMGTVQRVGLRTTRLTSLGGEHLVLPNADLTGSRIRNYRRMQERRIVSSVGVTYGTPYERIREIPDMLREIITSAEGVRFDRAHFAKYGDFALTFEYVYYVLSPDYNKYMDVQQSINLEIFRRFEKAGIKFALPTRTVHLHQAPQT